MSADEERVPAWTGEDEVSLARRAARFAPREPESPIGRVEADREAARRRRDASLAARERDRAPRSAVDDDEGAP